MTSHPEFNHSTDGSLVAQVFSDQIKRKNVLITGVGPESIGRTTAINIASQKPSLLIIAGRDKEKVSSVESEIKSLYPSVNVRVLLVDLSSQNSVRHAANEVNNYPEPTIDILINNAGVMAIPERTVSEDGIETQFATNHVGHFLLTNLILDKIKAAAKQNPPGATRIINVSSSGHRISPVRFEDWNFKGQPLAHDEKGAWAMLTSLGEKETDGYHHFIAYGQSKTANILFSEYLTRNLNKYGIVSLALNPGEIKSGLVRHLTSEMNEKLAPLRAKAYRKTQDQGSSTTLVAALDPKLDGSSVYLDHCQIGQPASYAIDSEKANKLWELTEEIVYQHFEL